MSKPLEYTLEYYEQGEKMTEELKISFVSNRVVQWYNDLTKSLTNVQETNKKIQVCKENLAGVFSDKSLSFREKREESKAILAEEKELSKLIAKYNKQFVFQEKWKVVEKILKGNGIRDEKLLDGEFWFDHTQDGDMWKFATSCVYKDLAENLANTGEKKKSAIMPNL